MRQLKRNTHHNVVNFMDRRQCCYLIQICASKVKLLIKYRCHSIGLFLTSVEHATMGLCWPIRDTAAAMSDNPCDRWRAARERPLPATTRSLRHLQMPA